LRHAGRFAGGPEFLEVICLGQAIRRDNRSEEP
jgi:hypothetical protein